MLENILNSFREYIKNDHNKTDEEITQFLQLFYKEKKYPDVLMINWYYIENGIIKRSNYPGDIGLNIPQNTPGYWKTLENIEVGFQAHKVEEISTFMLDLC